jgi:hypothetical protein
MGTRLADRFSRLFSWLSKGIRSLLSGILHIGITIMIIVGAIYTFFHLILCCILYLCETSDKAFNTPPLPRDDGKNRYMFFTRNIPRLCPTSAERN